MKVYAYRNGEAVTAEVPDGSIWMQIGSNSTPDGKGLLQPIVEIDLEARIYRRMFGEREPFPENAYYLESDIAWRPADS